MAVERSLATVLFTDIVGSTERAAGMGDEAWHALLDRHHAVVRRWLKRFAGREVKTAGDGFLVVFDSPSRALTCADAIRNSIRELGLEVRCGLHMGEIEHKEGDVGGLAVHIGSRVASIAGPSEVFVSSTVVDAEAGSGFRFEERGRHELKGVPGQWRVHALVGVPEEAKVALLEAASEEPVGLGTRLRRSRLVPTLVAYAAATALLLWGTTWSIDRFGLPGWAFPIAALLAAIGLVLIVATAWVQSSPDTRIRAAGGELPRSRALDIAGLAGALRRGELPHLTWGRTVAGGVFAFSLLFGLAGLYVVIRDRGRSFAPSEAIAEAAPGIAVLPFETSGPDLDVWREGVVDLLSTNIDGVAGLRAIDSRTVLARWGERVTESATPDLETSIDVARRAGAHYAVLGNAAALGPAVRLTADIYDVQDGRSLGHAMVEGSPDSVYMLIDRLSIEILRAVLGGKAENLPRVGLAHVTTTSLPALRAYLAGEVLYRRADFAAAIPEYQRAVEADSTFALANHRLAQSYGWSQNIGAEPALQAAERAARFADRLPEREAIVVRADYALDRGSLEELDPLRDGVVKYPDDPELWYLLADTYNHLGQRALVPYEEEARAWERLLALSSDFAPYYIHPIENAAQEDDSARFAELLPRYLRLAPEGIFARRFTLLRDLLWGTPEEVRMARAEVDTADGRVARGVANVLWASRRLPLGAELYATLRRRSDATANVAMNIHWNAMTRGKVAEAITVLDDPLVSPSFRVARMQGIRSLGFTVEPARLDRAVTEMYADTAAEPYAFLAAGAWGVDRGRAEEVERARSRLREVSARYLAAGDSFRAGSVNGTIAGLDGYVAWKRGQRDEALALFERARREIVGLGGLSVSGDIVRWWTGELIVEMDRPKDAALYFESFDPPDPFRAIRLGGIYEKLGDRDKAREEYEEVLAVLVDPDPEIRSMVAQAREGLGRLGFRPRT